MVSYAKRKNFIVCHFWRPYWILAENNFVNILVTERDRVITRKCLTHRVVQKYPVPKEKFQFSPLLAAILDLSGK